MELSTHRYAPSKRGVKHLTSKCRKTTNHNIPQALDGLRAHGNDIARVVSHPMPLDESAAVMGGYVPKGGLKVQFTKV